VDKSHQRRVFFTTWPGLTSELVTKHLPKSLAQAKGYLRQDRKGQRSTQPTHNGVSRPPEDTDPEESPTHTNWVHMKPIEVTGKIRSDQTGCFPIASSRGNKHIMIVCDYNSNAILDEPLKSHSELELLKTHMKIHLALTSKGLKPNI
jgi:hypothetical protein